MFYLLVASNIIYLFVSFAVLDGIPLLKRSNLWLLFMISLLFLSFFRLNLYIPIIDEFILFTFLLVFSFMNNRRQWIGLTFFHLSIAYILQYLANHLLLPDFLLTYLIAEDSGLRILLYIFLMAALVGMISLVLKKYGLTKLSQKTTRSLGYGLFLCIFTYQLYTLYDYVIHSPAETQAQTLIQLFVFLLLFLTTIGIISVYTLSNNQKLAFETSKKVIEQEAMQVYIDELSKQSQDIRKFRHDYINILSSLDGYLEEEDFDELKAYYHQSIQPTRHVFSEHFLRLDDLQKIENSALRSIFTTKLILAQEKGLDVQLEVTEKIQLPQAIDPVLLVRIVGILLDNAIEELIELQEGKLEVALFKLDTDTLLLIQNTVRSAIEPLHQLKVQGFSTKGTSRGLGLSTVDELVSQSPLLLLETTIHPPHFTQKITLLGE